MRFDEQRSIFLQIGDFVDEMILRAEYPEGERIPSVREMAARMEVNPNTIIRAYAQLQEQGVIYNQRGLGYFVADGARQAILDARREEFKRETLPELFRAMTMLEIDFSELERLYAEYQQGADR